MPQARDERFLSRYTQHFGRASAVGKLATLNEARQADHASRLPDAQSCVTLLQAISPRRTRLIDRGALSKLASAPARFTVKRSVVLPALMQSRTNAAQE